MSAVESGQTKTDYHVLEPYIEESRLNPDYTSECCNSALFVSMCTGVPYDLAKRFIPDIRDATLDNHVSMVANTCSTCGTLVTTFICNPAPRPPTHVFFAAVNRDDLPPEFANDLKKRMYCSAKRILLPGRIIRGEKHDSVTVTILTDKHTIDKEFKGWRCQDTNPS